MEFKLLIFMLGYLSQLLGNLILFVKIAKKRAIHAEHLTVDS